MLWIQKSLDKQEIYIKMLETINDMILNFNKVSLKEKCVGLI